MRMAVCFFAGKEPSKCRLNTFCVWMHSAHKKKVAVCQQTLQQFEVLMLCIFITRLGAQKISGKISHMRQSVITSNSKPHQEKRICHNGKTFTETESFKAPLAAPRGAVAPYTHKVALTDPSTVQSSEPHSSKGRALP